MNAITTDNLTKLYKGGKGIENLTLSIKEGEVVSLLGPNGAGKTTTVRMLSGMIAPTSGKAEVFGIDVKKEPVEIHKHIGLLTESPGFYENMSLTFNLRFFGSFYEGIDLESNIKKYMSELGLLDRADDPVSSLSKGLKQRLAICRCLVHEPRLLFLDEPASGLDPEAASDIKGIIKNLKKQGRTILICTHNLDEADELSDRIAIIKGRLIEMRSQKEIKEKYFNRVLSVTANGINPEIVDSIRKIEGVKSVMQTDRGIDIETPRDIDIRQSVLKKLADSNIEVLEFFERSATLEDAYLKIVSGGDTNE